MLAILIVDVVSPLRGWGPGFVSYPGVALRSTPGYAQVAAPRLHSCTDSFRLETPTRDRIWKGPAGWRLSPAYDLNPTPTDIKPRELSLAVDDHDHAASLELAFQVAEYFGMDDKTAHGIASEVGQAVASWRNEAECLGLRRTEIDRMASAFEHADLRQAINRP